MANSHKIAFSDLQEILNESGLSLRFKDSDTFKDVAHALKRYVSDIESKSEELENQISDLEDEQSDLKDEIRALNEELKEYELNENIDGTILGEHQAIAAQIIKPSLSMDLCQFIILNEHEKMEITININCKNT